MHVGEPEALDDDDIIFQQNVVRLHRALAEGLDRKVVNSHQNHLSLHDPGCRTGRQPDEPFGELGLPCFPQF